MSLKRMEQINDKRIAWIDWRFYLYNPEIFGEDKEKYREAMYKLFEAMITIFKIHDKHKEVLAEINKDLKK